MIVFDDNKQCKPIARTFLMTEWTEFCQFESTFSNFCRHFCVPNMALLKMNRKIWFSNTQHRADLYIFKH